jgi:hypothetical protein
MRRLPLRSLFIYLLPLLGACAQVGIPTENRSSSGHLDTEVNVTSSRLKSDLEKYLRARSLLEAEHGDKEGNWYLHQNWVQSSSIRYYQLNFDRRKRHLSEWKALWYIQANSKGRGTKLRIAVLELLYLGDPDHKVKAPKTADGNWVETDFDQERAKLLFEDFMSWRSTGNLNNPPLFLKVEDLKFPPKSKTEIRQGTPFMAAPWWF